MKARGSTADQAVRLFDRFYRGSQARTGEGTGLGLSIVAALAAAHGGRAFVNSVPGHGTVFTVELPASDSTTEAGDIAPLGSDGAGPGSVPVDDAGPPAVSADADTLAPAHHGHRPVRR